MLMLELLWTLGSLLHYTPPHKAAMRLVAVFWLSVFCLEAVIGRRVKLSLSQLPITDCYLVRVEHSLS